MDQKGDKSTRELLIDVIHSDMAFAQVLADVARSKYSQGKIEEGNEARLKALKFCFKAHESVLQISENDRQSDLKELEKLRSLIASLSAQPVDLEPASSGRQETPQSGPLSKRFKPCKFWQKLN
jgi:hypothetical protein